MICIFFNPFLPTVPSGVCLAKTSISIKERIIKKSYERRDYESVDVEIQSAFLAIISERLVILMNETAVFCWKNRPLVSLVSAVQGSHIDFVTKFSSSLHLKFNDLPEEMQRSLANRSQKGKLGETARVSYSFL